MVAFGGSVQPLRPVAGAIFCETKMRKREDVDPTRLKAPSIRIN